MTVQMGIPLAHSEMLDPLLQVRACNRHSKLDLSEEPLLLAEFHGPPKTVKDDVAHFSEICPEFTCSPFQWSNNPKERNKLWRAGQAWLLAQKMGEAVDLMARIKAALDPQNILNPGKLFG
jgi:FAD/FMN-containing dehydrogenase